MTKDIHKSIVGFKILVEWSDNPKLVDLDYDMPNYVSNVIDEWFNEIEKEENI